MIFYYLSLKRFIYIYIYVMLYTICNYDCLKSSIILLCPIYLLCLYISFMPKKVQSIKLIQKQFVNYQIIEYPLHKIAHITAYEAQGSAND